MGLNTKTQNREAKKLTKVSLHHGRLRKFLQLLKERNATIRIDHDKYGKSRTATYGDNADSEYSLKDLLLSIWTDATDYAYYEYFKKNFEIVKSRPSTKKYHPSYEKLIVNLKCTFKFTPDIDNPREKDQLFFSGDRPQATNIYNAFPDIRLRIQQQIDRFIGLLENTENRFPYQALRNHTSHRCHRYKSLEKDIFQFLKDADKETKNEIRVRLKEVMSAYSKHLTYLEEKGIGHGKPEDRNVIQNRLTFQELSDIDAILIDEVTEEQLSVIRFENAFSEPSNWFDQNRYKKIHYWEDDLKSLAIADWPEYFLEHILLAYYELNTVCSEIVSIRDQIFDEVRYRLKFSKDGVQMIIPESAETLQDLSKLLSKYEYESNAFVNALRSDGNLLVKALRLLPDGFIDEERYPDRLFQSRIEKLLWEYLLYRMCDSCELKIEHVEDFYTPLYNPAH